MKTRVFGMALAAGAVCAAGLSVSRLAADPNPAEASPAVTSTPSKTAGARRAPLALGLKAGARTYTTGPDVTRPMGRSPIPNFGEVAPGTIYRSGQPTAKGYEWLKEQGFRSIVCLRKEHDNDATEMAKYGFRYLYIPIIDEDAPTTEQGEAFVKFASQPENWPLLVHCHGGEGRAATMAALVRYSFDGWQMNLALREAGNYRYHRWIRGSKICSKQRRFLAEWEKTHKPGSFRPGGDGS